MLRGQEMENDAGASDLLVGPPEAATWYGRIVLRTTDSQACALVVHDLVAYAIAVLAMAVALPPRKSR